MIAGIAYTSVSSAQFFLEPVSSSPVDRSAVTADAATSTHESQLDLIRSRHLFGVLKVDHHRPPAAVPEAVATRLPLILQGVFVADGGGRSVAIVALPNRHGLRYAIGDTLPGSVELVSVASDHVVLDHGGVRETLHFPTHAESQPDGPGVLSADFVAPAVTEDGSRVGRADVAVESPDRYEPGYSAVLGRVPEPVDAPDS